MEMLTNRIRSFLKSKVLTQDEKHLLENISHLDLFGFQKFGNFDDEDVFLVGYPKSGNTLLQVMMGSLVYGLNSSAPKALNNSCITEFYNNPYYFRYDKRHYFNSHELPRPEFKNVIYIIRDGRAAVKSFYHMQRNMGVKVDLDELYLNGGKTFRGTWNEHVKIWTENPFNANILFVKYEDLISDKTNEIRRICEFLNLDRTIEEIKVVEDVSSLENMKKMESSYSWQRIRSYQNWKSKGLFVREGKLYEESDDPTSNQEVIRSFVDISAEMLRKYGYID